MGVGKGELSKGDEVYVVVHVADGAPQRRIKGRVKDVMRAAARITDLEDGRGTRTVRFNQLEKVKPEPKEPGPVKATAKALATEVRPSKRETGMSAANAPPAPVVSPADSDDAFAAWLEMGREVIGPIESELAELNAQAQQLESEKRAIEDELDAISERKLELTQRTRKFRSIVEALAK